MDHPNIARVYDAGTTENGRPYFVMELVQGIPITEYCDEHELSVDAASRICFCTCVKPCSTPTRRGLSTGI